MNDRKKEEILDTWASMQENLMGLEEGEVKELLDYEKGWRKRISILNRLYARYNELRSRRERAELLGGVV